MKEYYITVDTGFCGYEFNEIIEAETKEEAKRIAIKNVEKSIRYMQNHLRAIVTEEYDLNE